MPGKGSEFDVKGEKIVMDRVRYRLVDQVHRADNAEDYARMARDKLNYFYDDVVASSLDMGVRKGKVLDLGTQFGLCAINLAKQEDYDFKIISFQDTVKFARMSREFAENDLVDSDIKWITGNQMLLPFRDRMFDLVISGFDMHHWENPVSVFNEVERVLKKDGAFMIADLRRDAFSVMSPILKGVSYVIKNEKLYKEMEASFNSSYTKNEVTKLLAKSDLSGYEVSKDVQFVYIKRSRPEKKRIVVRFSGA